MKRILILAVIAVFLSGTIAGCAMDDFFAPNYGNKEYPTTYLPDPAAAKRKQQEPPADKPQRVTAPDEEAKLGPTPKSATQTVRDENMGGHLAAVSPTGAAKTSRTIFTGAVSAVDYVGKTISIKTAGKNMTFDLKNPVVRGYANIGEIQIGDTVTLGYIKDGLGIVKGENFPRDLQKQASPDEPTSSRKARRSTPKQSASNRAAPVRARQKVNRLAFNDVDNNKDGRISPVELGTVLPSLTMEDFKKYDRNADGALNETEYRDVKKR